MVFWGAEGHNRRSPHQKAITEGHHTRRPPHQKATTPEGHHTRRPPHQKAITVAWWRSTSPPMATAAGGTHPTGMHSCLIYLDYQQIVSSILSQVYPYHYSLQYFLHANWASSVIGISLVLGAMGSAMLVCYV